MNDLDQKLLEIINDKFDKDKVAYNIRKDGVGIERSSTDEAVIEKQEYTFSKEKEALPLYYFVASLGSTLNDNTNNFLFENLNRITSE